MSVIAGRLAPQVGATCFQTPNGGRGILLGAVPGIPPNEVIILGAGNVGLNAVKIASGMGARATIIGLAEEASRLDYVGNIFRGCVDTGVMNGQTLPRMIKRTDILVGSVRVKGATSAKLVTREMIKNMK